MKVHPYQLSRWCSSLIHGRNKWLWLAANVILLVLALLLRLLWLALPPLLLIHATLALYLLHRHHAFGECYQRKPCPQDALCETVLIDADLIGQGTRLRAVAQPVDVAESLSLRLGSGTLLLGTAMTLTADALPPADRAAVLSAVQVLNIKPDRMRSHHPTIAREELNHLTVITVRDGMSQRRYYLGQPADVARQCASIWEGSTRPLTEQDHLQIQDSSRYIAQGACRVYAWATALDNEAPVFLGLAGLGEALHLPALQDAAALRSMGLTVMLDDAEHGQADLESLRALMELPAHHARADIHLTPRTLGDQKTLNITCRPGDSLTEPISLLRQHFHTIEDTLRRFALLLGLTLLTALLSACQWIPVLLTGLTLLSAITIGVDLTAPKLRWPSMLAVCLLALLSRAFLSAQSAELAFMVSGCVSITAAFSAILRLCGKGFTLYARSPLAITIASAVMLLGTLVYGLLQGTAALLPLVLALLISAAIALLIAFSGRDPR